MDTISLSFSSISHLFGLLEHGKPQCTLAAQTAKMVIDHVVLYLYGGYLLTLPMRDVSEHSWTVPANIS